MFDIMYEWWELIQSVSAGTTSMVAAICYAWLLECRQRGNDHGREYVVAPVMNLRRGTMWKLRQAAWLFYHASLDTTSLLFANEVILYTLMTGLFNVRNKNQIAFKIYFLLLSYVSD